MDVLYTVLTDGNGKIFLKNANDEIIAQATLNPDWSEEHQAEFIGCTFVRHALLEESYKN